jgi:hypothetical protein
LSCAICEERKEKRFCPAVHGRICPQCCGEQREVTLDCPSECPYLLQARQQTQQHTSEHGHHSMGQNDRVDRDRRALLAELEIPDVEIPQQFLYEREELILGLSFALTKCARADRSLMDHDLLAAVSTLARTYNTMVNSSLIYEPPTTNLAHQAVVRDIARGVDTLVREYREAEQRHIGLTRLRDSDVLKALVFLLQLGVLRTSGRPKSRGFIDFLLAQFPEKQSVLAGPEEAGSRIVIP